MNDIGWIKLHRKIKDWEGYPNIKRLGFLVYLLLKINWEDKKWRGILIKRGSFVTSMEKLCLGTGLNERQTRYLISVMRDAGELSIKGTNKYTVISINNFDSYQKKCQTNVKQSVNQMSNKVSTTKEDKNIRSKEYISPTPLYENKWTLEEVGKLVVESFNSHLGTTFKDSKSFLKGLERWLETYTPQEIEQAIKQIKYDKFWNGKMTPVLLFRQKNPQGEPVDYIGGLLNNKEKYDDRR